MSLTLSTDTARSSLQATSEQISVVSRNIARRQRRPPLARLEGRHLLVEGSDPDALLVIEHRAVDRPGDMVFGKLCRRADIDDGVEFVEPVETDRKRGGMGRHV